MFYIKRMSGDVYDANVRPTKEQRIIQLVNNQRTRNPDVHKIDALIRQIDCMLGR